MICGIELIKARKIVRDILEISSDEYWENLIDLEEDIEFFRMYMKRNKKSKFNFDLKVSCGTARNAFNDIWKKHGYSAKEEDIEDTFCEFVLIRSVIEDIAKRYEIHATDFRYTRDEIKSIIVEFEQYDDTKLIDYVSDFEGCSLTAMCVNNTILELYKEIEDDKVEL